LYFNFNRHDCAFSDNAGEIPSKGKRKMKNIIIPFLLIFFNQLVLADEVVKQEAPAKNITFDKKTIEAFQSIPILSEGRVKPLNTYASFLLLRLNGKRVIRTESGKKIKPMEWFLTVLFYPDEAKKQKIFLVDNSEVLESVGAKDIKPRDRYSFEDLSSYFQDLMKKAGEIDQKEAKARSLRETQTLHLAMNLVEFLNVTRTLDFARPMTEDPSSLGITLNKPPRHVIAQMAEAQKKVFEVEPMKSLSPEKQKAVVDEFNKISVQAIELFHDADWLTIFPPAGESTKLWRSPFALLSTPKANSNDCDSFSILNSFEETCLAVQNKKETPESFKKLADTLVQQINKQPTAAKYIAKINTENLYYKIDMIYNSLILFIVGFLSICFSFMNIKATKWHIINIFLLSIPVVMLVGAIAMRCFILERPPVATLYETILFITSIICLVSLGIERIFKNKLALFATSIVGSGGLFLSYAYERGDGTDTMGNLAAVLNSNFWLSTHVTSVTIGYSAGLLASVFAHIYIFAKVFRITEDKEFYKTLSKIIYGVLCFCTLFATVGTILGGIWANYSWGRFWGWDPKENGALAIVLWNLIILHGRMGGIFRDFGLTIMSIFGGMVVVASWWGVNQLGIGLHSYGFTNGIVNNLIVFAVLELSIIAVAIYHHYVIDRQKKSAEEKS
jgi:ABC-type transport system involved in cytochrome c biogenesis permease subunit